MDNDGFLSSLSPRKVSKKKWNSKGPAVLSLKKYFRKSLLCDRMKPIVPNKSIEIIEISSSDSLSNENINFTSMSTPTQFAKFKADEKSFQSENIEEVIPPSPQRNENNLKYFSTGKTKIINIQKPHETLSRKKLFNVGKWIENDNCKENIIRTEEPLENSVLSYEVFEMNTKNYHNVVNSTIRPESFSPKSSENINSQFVENAVNSDTPSIDESCENLLDDLYGHSWRGRINEIFPNTEKKMKKVKHPPKDLISHSCPRICRKNSVEKVDSKPTLLNELKTNNVQDVIKHFCRSDENIPEYSSGKTGPLNSNKENILQRGCNEKSTNQVQDVISNYCNSEYNSDHSLDDNVPVEKLNNEKINIKEKKKRKVNVKKGEPVISGKENDNFKKRDNVLICNENECLAENEVISNKLTSYKEEDILSVFESARKCDELYSLEEKSNTYSFIASLSKNIPDSKCHKVAKLFRDNYKQNRDILAKELFILYNEKVFKNALPKSTALEWNDRMVSTAGYCYSRKITDRNGVERTARIVLSTKVLDRAERLRDTLIHEMCHAATWIVNHVHDGHGKHWRSWANKAEREFPELPPVKTCHNYEIQSKYVYRCTGCGYSIRRHRKSLDIERKRCGYCHGKFEILMNKTNKKGEQKIVPVTPKKNPTGFALFVKENYSKVKTSELNHAGVMKLLGEKFKEIKL